MKSKRRRKLSEQLRDIIGEAAVSRYRIAKESGVDESGLSKFANGTNGLSLDSIDQLGLYLKLRLVIDDEPDQKKE